MSLPELGDLRKVRVLHDNSGLNPSWFLDKVIVTFHKLLQPSQITKPLCSKLLAKYVDTACPQLVKNLLQCS